MNSEASMLGYNTSFVYCRKLAPGTVSLTGGWVRGDDSKQNSYNMFPFYVSISWYLWPGFVICLLCLCLLCLGVKQGGQMRFQFHKSIC